MSQTVYASFSTPEEAERTAGILLDRGLKPEDLSVVRRHGPDESSTTEPRSVASNVTHSPVDTGSPEPERRGDELLTPDTKAGAVKGSLVGAGLGALAALAALVVPGVGLVIGAGALASALGGIVATAGVGAAAGAFVAHLKEEGVEEDVAGEYGDVVQRGGAVLAVTLPSGALDEAAVNAVLQENAAINVNRYVSRA